MTTQHLRLIYMLEFLVAVVAVFTAWSEIGGQGALDIMPWGWKLGLALALSGAIVGYSASLIASESLWNARTAKWLTAVLVLIVGMGLVTYYYVLQEDSTVPEEQENVTSLRTPDMPPQITPLVHQDRG